MLFMQIRRTEEQIMKEPRTSVTVACAQATKHLHDTGKQIFSEKDIRIALTKAKRGSTSSMIHYMGEDGHLVERGFLNHVVGGYELAASSMEGDKIMIDLPIGNEFLLGEVSAAISRALTPFKGVVTDSMEV